MKLTEDIKNNIRFLFKMELHDEFLKELMKLNQKNTEEIQDIFFINYNLSLYYYKKQMLDAAKHHIEIIRREIEQYKFIHQFEYNSTLWLYAEINKNEMSLNERVDLFYQIHTYYKRENDYRNSLGILSSIHVLNKDDKKIIELLEDVLCNHQIQELIDGIVNDCKKISDDCYNRALTLKKSILTTPITLV